MANKTKSPFYDWDGPLVFHPVALMFPEMSDEEKGRLKCSIAESGLHTKILTLDGKIIDGRHRALACQELGVPISCEEWDGDPAQLVQYVVDENIARRHLTQSQLSMVAVDVEKYIAEEIRLSSPPKQSEPFTKIGKSPANQSSRDAHKEAAVQIGVSKSYVTEAKRIAAKSPEVALQVKNGEITITEAKKSLGLGRTNGDTDEIPARFMVLLKGLPPGQQLAVWRKAQHAAPDGVPTTNQIIAAAGVKIEECAAPETLADVIEEVEERKAIQDESANDEAWLETLPLKTKLSASCRRIYFAEALAARWLAKAQAAWGRSVALALGRMKHRHGPYMYRIQMGLKVDPPEKWTLCPPLTEGGCNGRGRVKAGEGPDAIDIKCPRCHSNGYLVMS